MAVSINNFATSVGNPGGGTSLTYSYTCSSGADRLLLVQTGDVGAASAVSYAGSSLTAVGSLTGSLRVWRKTAPATGANNIVFTVGSYASTKWTVADFTGVDQTTPLGSQVSQASVGTAPTTGSITVPTGGMAWGGVFTGYTTTTTLTTSAGTLASWQKSGGSMKGGAYRTTTGSLSWVLTSAPNWWAQGFPINAAASFTAKLPELHLQAVQRSVI